jgi:alpha-glucosidase
MCRLLVMFALLWSAAAALPASAQEAGAPRACSPSGVICASVGFDNDGRASYQVTRGGEAVIAPSRLGFMLADAPKLERGLRVVSASTRDVNETWEQPWGERRFVVNAYRELSVELAESGALQRRFTVVFRLYDDGLGLRYVVPDQDNLQTAQIVQELTEFAIARPGEAWWIPAMEWNREEYLYNRTAIDAVGLAQTPITMRLDSGVHVSLHEAALIDYAGMNLSRAEGRRFRAFLTPGSGVAAVVRDTPFATPWRTIQIAEDAAGLANSSLILNLNAPNALGDVSFFRPMRYVGIWWEMHLGQATWSSGPRHGATTERAIRAIDFASENGFGGVLIEGWNRGWDGNWFGDGWEFSFAEPYPDFDLDRVAAHARARGVQVIGHHETGGNAFHYERNMEAGFALYQRLGIHVVKTGYVADAGQAWGIGPNGLPVMIWHESQAMVNHQQRVVEAAFRHAIAINPHEPVKDTGLRRTYPNLVSREGARGMEFNAWGQPGNPPEHEANLVFTRLLAGPMDFTPGILGMETQSPDGVATTWAKQLALYVVIYSPIQMAADLIENYEANPIPFSFIRTVPTDWEESIVLNGEVGDYVTAARQERGGPDWYLGAVTDEHPRALSVPLTFLQPGQRYRAHIYADAADAHWRGARERLVVSTREVTGADVLTLHLAPGGGQAIRFEALSRSRRRR